MPRASRSRWLCPVLVALIAVPAMRPILAQPTSGSGSAIEGTVRDAASGRPLPNAQVAVVGTTVGAVTGDAGTYRIANAPVGSAVQVRVRLIGYGADTKTVAVALGQTTRVDFTLQQSALQLDQVVVTGTGAAVETKKVGNTVATVDMSELRTAPIQNASEALAARSPGVSVLPSGGTTGAGARIRIRGNASLSQSNNPVIYIDGVRADNGGSGAGGAVATSRLDDIDPSSIDHMEILKGAAAATLYGTEASNGVIQIFTKKGAQGAARWNVDLSQSAITYPDRVAPNAGFARTAAQADTLSRIFGQTITPFVPFEYNVTKQLWETGQNSTANASVSGGADKVNYFVGGRFEREDGPFTSQKVGGGASQDLLKRTQGTLNLNVLPTSKITVGFQSRYTVFRIGGIQGTNSIYSPYAEAMYAQPDKAYCNDASGRRSLDFIAGPARCSLTGNPFGNTSFTTIREAVQQDAYQDGTHYTGSLTAGWTPSVNLHLSSTVGIDNTDVRAVSYYAFGNNVDLFSTNAPLGSRSVNDLRQQNVTVDTKANWNHTLSAFESQFTLGAQGFITTQKNETGTGRDFPGPGLAVTGAGSTQTSSEGYVRVVNAGYFAQDQLGFHDWIYTTVGARYDYNSAFGESAGGVLYPKLSVSIVPSDRKGHWDMTTLSSLRLRGAIGRSGRQPGAFDKFTTYRPLAASSNGALVSGLVPDNLGNPDLKPEVTTEIEGGFEAGLFNNRAQLTTTYWTRQLKDALVAKQFAVSGGFTARQLTNIGRLDAHGLELGLNGFVVNRSNLAVDLFANGSYLSQKVVSLGGAPQIKVVASYVRVRGYIKEGYTPGALFGAKIMAPCSTYKNPATDAKGGCLQPGETPYDQNRDGKPDTEAQLKAALASAINPTNLVVLRADDDGNGDLLDHYQGKPYPDWSGAFGGNLRLGKAWRLSNLFEYKAGHYTISDLTDSFRNASPTLGRNRIEASQVEATLLNPASTSDQRYAAAQNWLGLVALSPYEGTNQNKPGDFLRWREVSLTYTTPGSIARRIGARDLALTFAARNLLLWTRYTGTDPEINVDGTSNSLDASQAQNNFYEATDAFGLPIPRRFTFSARVGF